MNQAQVGGGQMAYHEAGSGEAVLLLHPGFVADGMVPLLARPELAGYRLVAPHRRGYGQSAPATPPLAMPDLAADLIGLMDAIGLGRVHLVGHSVGACVALEAARRVPDRVATLALLEPPLGFFLSAESTAFLMGAIGTAMQRFGAGDQEGAVKSWLDGAFGSGWEEPLERALPGAVDQATKDAPTALLVEGGALQEWRFSPADLAQITIPILSIVHPNPVWDGFREIHEALVETGAEGVEINVASHLLQVLDPAQVARGLASYLGAHPAQAVSLKV